jgi:hypothetical protein
MVPEFVIQYECFPEQKNTLIWPEFADASKLKNQGTWEKFGELRAFLADWATHTEMAPIITEAFKEFRSRPLHQRRGLPLPAGFVLDRARIATLPAPARTAVTTALRSRSSRSGRKSIVLGRHSGENESDSYQPSSRDSPRYQPGSSPTTR